MIAPVIAITSKADVAMSLPKGSKAITSQQATRKPSSPASATRGCVAEPGQ
jgi:hypothetical protein